MSHEQIKPSEKPSEVPKFDIDKALNIKPFVEFLATYPDADKLELTEANEEEIKKRFETFEVKNKVSKDLKPLFKEQIRKDVGLDIERLDPKALEVIDKYISSEAIRNPEQILELGKQIQESKTLAVEIDNAEARMQELLKKLGVEGDLKEMKQKLTERGEGLKKLKDAREKMGFGKRLWKRIFGKGEEKKIAKTDLERLDEEIKKIDEEVKTLIEIESIQKAKEVAITTYNGLRTAILYESAFGKSIFEIAKKKVQENLRASIESAKTLTSLEKIQAEIIDRYKKTEFDYLEGVDFQKQIDEALEKQFEREIIEAIRDFQLTSSPLQSLESVLKRFITKEKLGFREREEVKSLVRETIGKQIEKETNLAKRILLKRILAKIEG